METKIIKINEAEFTKLVNDVELIKNILMSEGELTDWAKNELKNAREESEDEYTPLEEL